MKAKVVFRFRDRLNEKDIYEVGDTFEGSDERVAELAANGYVEPIAEKPKAPRKPRAKKE